MNRINDQYSGDIDVFYLDVDDPSTSEIVQPFGVRARSTYVLLDANGERVTFWSGPLNEQTVQASIDALLADS